MVPLVVRSHYSLLRGTASPEEICAAARRMGYRKLALTDRDNLYGLWRFLEACRRNGLDPVVGAEVTSPRDGGGAVCLVKDARGFRNLCRLVSRRRRDPGFVLRRAVEEHAEGLVVLTTEAGLLAAWRRAGVDVAAAVPVRPSGAAARLLRTAGRLGAPVVAAPDAWFLRPGDYHLHRLVRAVACATTVSRLSPGEVASPNAWLAPPREYARRFRTLPRALAESRRLAERVGYVPEARTVTPPWDDPLGRDADQVLRREAYAGARRRYGAPLPRAVVERLEHELSVIRAKRFAACFLLVQEIVRGHPRTCGRGSAAASLVAYCLGITNVCPIELNLYFERFINPGRPDPPDIDVDFPWDERDGVIEQVLERHRGRAAMVCNHVLFRERMALREAARAHGLPPGEIGRVMDRLPWLEEEDGPWRAAGAPGLPPPWPRVLDLARRLVGRLRQVSVHVGGVVVTPGPIEDHAPVETAAKGVPLLQWDKDGVEDAGLVKIDLLGNRSLAVIRDTLAAIRRKGVDLREEAWRPEDDPATRELIARGDTMGCFYIESPAARLLQRKARRGDFPHLVIHTSIVRPAANDYLREYLRRLHGRPWSPLHPLVAGVLEETYGLMVYQEQVSLVAKALAGFPPAEGEALRKVLTRKDRSRALQDFRERFVAGAEARGVEPAVVEEAWRMIMSFSGYSFCKPHSASYARVSFQAAFLKAHFPAEFMAAVIDNQGGFYSTFAYVSEARRMGLEVLPPDVSRSEVAWRGEERRLRVGLGAIKGLGRATMERVVAERVRNGPYRDLEDFLLRVWPREDEFRALVHAGALDSLHPGASHAEMFWRREYLRASRVARTCGGGLLSAAPVAPPPLPGESEVERLRRQFRVLGFLVDRHPLELVRERMGVGGLARAKDLPRMVGRRMRLLAWVVAAKTVSTGRGERMRFVTLEDETGLVEAVVFPEPYRRWGRVLRVGRPCLVEGVVESEFGVATLRVVNMGRVVQDSSRSFPGRRSRRTCPQRQRRPGRRRAQSGGSSRRSSIPGTTGD